MFYRETDPYWSEEIRSDVIGECSQLGGVVHIHIDKEDPNGCVYLKAVNSSIANACVNSLQGRWFSGLSHFVSTCSLEKIFSGFRSNVVIVYLQLKLRIIYHGML